MASLFNPSARTPFSRQKVQNVDQVTLRKFVCIADIIGGDSSIMGIDEPLVGLLNSKPFAQGTMKVAFDVS